MRISRAYLKTFLGPRGFYTGALAVMVPVVIQQMINTLFNVVDTAMVSALHENVMAAVTVANKTAMIYNGCFFGVTGAGGLMLSQYYGAKDHSQCQSIFSLEMCLGFAFSLAYFALLRFFPDWLMGIYVQDAETIDIGASYLKIVSFSYLPAAVSATCIFSMRALGRNKTPMAISLSSLCMNALFNYVLIFGKLGFPALGVKGAALGTLLSRTVEMAIYLAVLHRRRAFFSLKLNAVLAIRKGVLKSYFRRMVPLTANELMWSTGLNVFFWAYARLEEASLPAIAVADQAFMVGFVLSTGVSSAVSVLIGTELGAGNLQAAKQKCKQLFSLVCLIALTCCAVGFLSAFVMPYIIAVKAGLRPLATRLTMVYSLFFPINCVYAFCFFCLRAGGDTKNATRLDSGYMWALPVPLSLALALFGAGRVTLMTAVFLVQLAMNLKISPALMILKKGGWLRNITLEG